MHRLLVLGVALMLAPHAYGEDLLAVFDRALLNDPQIREADAIRLANREAKPQALATLLPQISGSASKTRDDDTSSSQSTRIIGGQLLTFGGNDRSKPDTERWSIDLRQRIFSWADWVTLRQANKEVAQAEIDYQAAQQDLAQRVSTRYFDVLAAQDTVAAQNAALEAFSQLLEQAEKRFEVGLIAITDVQEARAARDTSAAALIAAKRQLSTSQELLQEIIGIQPASLAAPADTMPLKSPEPEDASAWVELSMEQNLALSSSRMAADIARDNVRKAFGGHLPQLDLLASRSNLNSTATTTFENGVSAPSISDQDSKSIGLQLSVPLFAGGGTQSLVRQQEYLWQASRARLERTSRQTERLARDAYLGVQSEISRVKALRQALESARTALQATEAGYEVGTRTAVDVLDSRRRLVQAETDYSRSRYDYIINVLQLQLAAGNLDREVLEDVNSWLAEK